MIDSNYYILIIKFIKYINKFNIYVKFVCYTKLSIIKFFVNNMNENTENKLKTKITDSIKKTSKYIETLNEDLTEKKKYSDYKIEKILELEMESKKLIESCDYEKAIIILKKLIFFDSESKIKILY